MADKTVSFKSYGSTDDAAPLMTSQPPPALLKKQKTQTQVATAESTDARRLVSIELEEFIHDPKLYQSETGRITERRERSRIRPTLMVPYDNTLWAALLGFFSSSLRTATVFATPRLFILVLFHFLLSAGLAAVYFYTPIADLGSDLTDTIKDFADLCITGIIFLLGGFINTMIARWWDQRVSCVGAMHRALGSLNLYAASIWPSASSVHREARALVARYSLLTYQLMFIEARSADYAAANDPTAHPAAGVEAQVRRLVQVGTITEEEARVLIHLPCKATNVLGWLAAFFNQVHNINSDLACAGGPQGFGPNSYNGRISTVFGQLINAHNAANLSQTYQQTQLPYGYVHLILTIVHLTILANTIYCGIDLGQLMQEAFATEDVVQVLAPAISVRLLRITLVPVLLNGMVMMATVIAMPLGEDDDDFPCGCFMEDLEDEILAQGATTEAFDPTTKLARAAAKP